MGAAVSGLAAFPAQLNRTMRDRQQVGRRIWREMKIELQPATATGQLRGERLTRFDGACGGPPRLSRDNAIPAGHQSVLRRSDFIWVAIGYW